MQEKINPNECRFNNGFLECIDIFNDAEKRYKDKSFKESLNLLKESLDKIENPSNFMLSVYYDLVASILWKIGEKNEAYYIWKRSLCYDMNNRHSILSLSLLYTEMDYLSSICELFIQIKLNEYFCLNNIKSDEMCRQEKVINYLLQYWKNNLSSMKFEDMDELEIVDYFINLKIF